MEEVHRAPTQGWTVMIEIFRSLLLSLRVRFRSNAILPLEIVALHHRFAVTTARIRIQN